MLVTIALGVAHAIVDASTVTAIFRCTHLGQVAPESVYGVVLAYDVVAFGSQVLLGWCTARALPACKSRAVLGKGNQIFLGFVFAGNSHEHTMPRAGCISRIP